MQRFSRALNIVLVTALGSMLMASHSDAVPDDADDSSVNDQLYSEVIQDESQFKSIESSSNTMTDPRFNVGRNEVCTAQSGAVIRLSSRWGYPQVHSNQSHVAVGAKRAYVNKSGDLVIKTNGGPIVSMYASPDETLVSRDIQVGLSGGTGTTIARFYSGRKGRVLELNRGRDWNEVQGTFSNVWVGWTHVVDC